MKDSLSGRRRLTRMRTFEVQLNCAVVGCAGYMVTTGQSVTYGLGPTQYQHRCSMCEIEEVLSGEHFPHFDYLPEMSR